MKRRAKEGESLALIKAWASIDTNDCVLWPFATAGKGYGLCYPYGQEIKTYTHRYVCEQKWGPAPSAKHDAAHTCGVSGCYNWRHLEWKTRTANHADKLIHGTHSRGERHGANKLTEAQVLAVRETAGVQTAVAEQFGISQTTVSQIKRKVRWAWL